MAGASERVPRVVAGDVRHVEPGGPVARELDVLDLILFQRHQIGAVEEDVGRHQHRVGEEPRPAARPRASLSL